PNLCFREATEFVLSRGNRICAFERQPNGTGARDGNEVIRCDGARKGAGRMEEHPMELEHYAVEEARSPSILVIDDDPMILDLLESALSEAGYTVTRADSGMAAVAAARSQKFDLAITDLRMPGMDGVKTLAALKEVSPETEVIVATGDGTIETAITCMKLGAYDYIEKPFQVKELHAIVARALEKRKLAGIVSLYESSRKLLATLDHPELVRLVTQQGRRLLRADEVILFLDEEGGYDIHTSGGELQVPATVVRSIARRSMADGNGATSLYCQARNREGESRGVLAVVFPLIGSKKRIGILIALYAGTHQERCEWEEGRLFATLATMALENASLYKEVQIHLEAQRRSEAQLRHNAFHDTLTALPNRALFLDRLSNTMHRARRHEEQRYAVLFLDLDRFKIINDSLGHAMGDRLLVETARRLEACLRASDTVARLGGDEFTVLLTDIRDEEDVIRTAQRIHRVLEEPIDLNGQRVFISTSIGIAFGTPAYESPEEILRDADIAMYQAKERGAGGHVIFDAEMHFRAITKLQLESDLRQALAGNELEVYYQPILSLESERLVGFEALVRWNHPLRGFVAPFDFLPLAEETGLIVAVDRWVMREA
ncbi:MAG: diguanylate cyclase, partial [Deltaproteobacteria bacterium]